MNLLQEGISIRDLVTIFESLADNGPTNRDTDILTEYVRQALKRAISAKYFEEKDSNQVLTLAPEIEQTIMEGIKHTEQGAYLSISPEVSQKILKLKP